MFKRLRQRAGAVQSYLIDQTGLDFSKALTALVLVPRYLVEYMNFKGRSLVPTKMNPRLHDRSQAGGVARGEYFWQDLHVARKIFKNNPKTHIDIGSRFDGFVTHLASFREVDVVDIRSISSNVPGVSFRQMDMMQESIGQEGRYDSASCLHALEHFGLGRYGDPIDPLGYVKGLNNITKLIKGGGILYLSVPIGRERVEFNANRVFCPEKLIDVAKRFGLRLSEFSWILPDDTFTHSENMLSDINRLSQFSYALGIFTFIKEE